MHLKEKLTDTSYKPLKTNDIAPHHTASRQWIATHQFVVGVGHIVYHSLREPFRVAPSKCAPHSGVQSGIRG